MNLHFTPTGSVLFFPHVYFALNQFHFNVRFWLKIEKWMNRWKRDKAAAEVDPTSLRTVLPYPLYRPRTPCVETPQLHQIKLMTSQSLTNDFNLVSLIHQLQSKVNEPNSFVAKGTVWDIFYQDNNENVVVSAKQTASCTSACFNIACFFKYKNISCTTQLIITKCFYIDFN